MNNSYFIFYGEFNNIMYNNIIPTDTRDINPGDLTDRLELKKKLKCKSFEWYLKNIYPESNLGKTIFLGFFRSGELCLDSFDRKHVATYSCHFSGGNQLMSMNDNNQIVIPEEKCLCKLPTNKLVTFCSCIQDDINQKWIWDKEVCKENTLYSKQ